MPGKKCPHCGLWNLETALKCDCGYDFSTEEKPPARMDSDKILKASFRVSWIGLGLSLLGSLPYLPLAGFYLSRSTPAHPAIRYFASFGLFPGFFFGFIFGFAGIILGVIGWARHPRNLKLFAFFFFCLLWGVAGIIGNFWFYATCQFCQ